MRFKIHTHFFVPVFIPVVMALLSGTVAAEKEKIRIHPEPGFLRPHSGMTRQNVSLKVILANDCMENVRTATRSSTKKVSHQQPRCRMSPGTI
mgnify:CR=1 FL=1